MKKNRKPFVFCSGTDTLPPTERSLLLPERYLFILPLRKKMHCRHSVVWVSVSLRSPFVVFVLVFFFCAQKKKHDPNIFWTVTLCRRLSWFVASCIFSFSPQIADCRTTTTLGPVQVLKDSGAIEESKPCLQIGYSLALNLQNPSSFISVTFYTRLTLSAEQDKHHFARFKRTDRLRKRSRGP